MRKSIIPDRPRASPEFQESDWLDLGSNAEVEITSEDPAHTIECALTPGEGGGWRAGEPGLQRIRLLFSPARRITRILLQFEETAVARTQEYVLQWSPEHGQPCREILRQQWNFTPGGATIELEEHGVDLPSVAVLELLINPDLQEPSAVASLQRMRVV
jgi:hypothetical protein